MFVPSDSAYVATAIEVSLPEGVTLDGNWSRPLSKPHGDDRRVRVAYGDAVFQHRLKLAEGLSGASLEFEVTVKFMACDEFRCLPPDEWTESITLAVER